MFPVWQPIILIAAIGSITIGTIGALYQNKLKRFIGYTSVVQASYLIFSMSCGTYISYKCTFTYLCYYNITLIILLLIFADISSKLKLPLIYLTSITSNKKFLSNYHLVVFVILIANLSNLPPTTIFFAKYYLLQNIFFITQSYFLIFFILLCSTCALYYYLRLVKIILFDSPINININNTNNNNKIKYTFIVDFKMLTQWFIFDTAIVIYKMFFVPIRKDQWFMRALVQKYPYKTLSYLIIYSTYFMYLLFVFLYFILILVLLFAYFI